MLFGKINSDVEIDYQEESKVFESATIFKFKDKYNISCDRIIDYLKAYIDKIDVADFDYKVHNINITEGALNILYLAGLDKESIKDYTKSFLSMKSGGIGIIVVGGEDSLQLSAELRILGAIYTTENNFSYQLSDLAATGYKLLINNKAEIKYKNGTLVLGCSGGVGTTTVSNELAMILSEEGHHKVCLFEKKMKWRSISLLHDVPEGRFSLEEVDEEIINDQTEQLLYKKSSELHIYTTEGNGTHAYKNQMEIEKRLSSKYKIFISDYSSSELVFFERKLLLQIGCYARIFLITNGSYSSVYNLSRLRNLIIDNGFDKDKIYIIYNDNLSDGIDFSIIEESFKGHSLYFLPRVENIDPTSIGTFNRYKKNKKFKKNLCLVSDVIIEKNVSNENLKSWTKSLKLFTKKQ